MSGKVRHADPDEPWRYRCPECGSACIHANVGAGVDKRERDAAYRCRAPCGWRGERVRDVKQDRLADPTGKGRHNGGPVPKEASV